MKTIQEIWEQNFKAAYPHSNSSAPTDWVVNAFKEYADQEKRALKEKLIKRFEEIKASGISMRDIIYLDGVLAVIETIDKE